MTARNIVSLPYAGSLAILVMVSGCVTPQQKVITWNRDSNESIVHFQKTVVQPNDINYSLCELDRGLLFFNNGDFLHSDTRLANAMRAIDQMRGKGEVGAVVWDERSKSFKGEPYERATACFYRGLCHFNQGNYSGALAAFRSSLAADAETRNKERQFLEDFTISHFMAALCYERLGEHDNAQAAMAMARNASPQNPFLTAGSLDHNFVAILGVGCGPFKTNARNWTTGPCPEQKVEVIVGSDPPKGASEATDLLAQARSQRWGQADTARIARRTGKILLNAVLQAATRVDAGLDDDYADVRCWQGLPLDFYLFTADVPPGNHKVTIKCYDQKGKEVERDRQVWFDVPVAAAKGPVLYLPVRQYWQNHYGVQEVKINPATEKAGK